MPRLSCWFIRAALVYLVLGFTLGGLLLVEKGVSLHPALWRLLMAHIDFLLFGWTVQLVMGVAFWILPRYREGASPRGNEGAGWLAFVLLNGGVWLAGVGPLLAGRGGLATVVPVLGRLAEAGAGVAFGVHAWSRVKPFGA